MQILLSSGNTKVILTFALFCCSAEQSVMNLHQREQYLNTSISWNPCECHHRGQSVASGWTKPPLKQFDTHSLFRQCTLAVLKGIAYLCSLYLCCSFVTLNVVCNTLGNCVLTSTLYELWQCDIVSQIKVFLLLSELKVSK